MKLIQIGNAKSGNFWLYTILQQVFKAARVDLKSFIQNEPIYDIAKNWKLSFSRQADVDHLTITPGQCYYRIGTILKMPIEDIDAYIDRCSHVWLQSPPIQETAEILSKFNKIVYILRDPRDVAISNSKFAFTSYRAKGHPHDARTPNDYLNDRLVDECALWVEHVGGYIKLVSRVSMHVIFYESLLQSFEGELKRLLAYLGIGLDQKAREAIEEAVSFHAMKKENPDHVRQGQRSGWEEILTPQQKKSVRKNCRSAIILFKLSIS